MSEVLRTGRGSALLLFAVVIVLSLYLVSRAKRKLPSIRRIAALDAIEEGVGRCAEMGRPLMWVPGAAGAALVGSGGSAAEVMTALSILGHAAGMAAKRGVRVIACTAWPEVPLLIEDVLRTAYATEGKPEMYNPNDVRFAPGWFPYVTAAMGWIGREKPATCLIVGAFGHESLTISESAWRAGAFGIGGTYGLSQLPWILGCNEYSFIAQEFFVAGAYIARDPDQLGGIQATDLVTFILIAVVVIGAVVATGGSLDVKNFWKL